MKIKWIDLNEPYMCKSVLHRHTACTTFRKLLTFRQTVETSTVNSPVHGLYKMDYIKSQGYSWRPTCFLMS